MNVKAQVECSSSLTHAKSSSTLSLAPHMNENRGRQASISFTLVLTKVLDFCRENTFVTLVD